MAVDYEVFISYRHAENDPLAAQLHRQLLAEHSIDSFRDAEELHFGDFRKQLVLNNLRSQYLLLLLTPTTLQKCSEPGDWVATEISLFLKLGKPIIPVKLQGFEYPELPDKIKGLLKHDHRAIVCNSNNPEHAARQIIEHLLPIVRRGWTPFHIDEARQSKQYLAKGNPDIHSYFCTSAMAFRKDLLLCVLSCIIAAVLLITADLLDAPWYAFLLTWPMMVLLTAEGYKLQDYDRRSLIDVILDTEFRQILHNCARALLFSLLLMIGALIAGFVSTLLGMLLGTALSLVHTNSLDGDSFFVVTGHVCILICTMRYLFRACCSGTHFLNAAFGRYPRKYLIRLRVHEITRVLRIVGWVLLAPAIALCGILALM